MSYTRWLNAGGDLSAHHTCTTSTQENSGLFFPTSRGVGMSWVKKNKKKHQPHNTPWQDPPPSTTLCRHAHNHPSMLKLAKRPANIPLPLSLSIECSLWLLVASLVGMRLCRWCSVPLTSTLVLILPTSEGWQAESTSWCILIQRPTGLELRTLGSQAATLTTKPTPGLLFSAGATWQQ